MSDEDKSIENEMLLWSIANKPKQQQVKFEPGSPGYGPAECDECGNDMPTVRRAYGYTECVGCASVREIKEAQYRH